MAQRTIHFVFGELLLRCCPVRDRDRFLFGSLLPDAYSGPEEREVTHFLNRSLPGRRYYDFEAFRSRFGAELMRDDLYLGYYIHLVEDSFYRRFFREHVSPTPLPPEEVAVLHRDYTLLNAYIVRRFGLCGELRRPEGFENEPLASLARFSADGLSAAFAEDLRSCGGGETHYLTEAMLEEYLARYFEPVLQELQTVQQGGRFLRAAELAWPSG